MHSHIQENLRIVSVNVSTRDTFTLKLILSGLQDTHMNELFIDKNFILCIFFILFFHPVCYV